MEEEFLLVDPGTGEPVARNREVAAHAERHGIELQLELTSCQVETTSPVAHGAEELRSALAALRRGAAQAASDGGAQLLAVALPPSVPHHFPLTDTPRYREIGERFGMIAHEQGICGCHVHVAVPDRETAIAVSNRLRPWLPTLLALSANSAVYRSADTGYASWRSVLWARWPTAGPPPHFESVADFDALVEIMRASGAALDDGMVYWDVRPSAKFPTVEVRVADVPATVGDTVLLAALVRALVMTALDDIEHDRPVKPLSGHALTAAYWRAARDGLSGSALDLVDSHALVPAPQMLELMLTAVTPALQAVGDYDTVCAELRRVRADGNGASRALAAWRRRHAVADVVAQVARATLAGID
ncbi:carboxylate-amine ligase [Mycolicibacterium canariasense]|uniref:Putative glutamate--cysteine ligase 2 n=1 Tax=Mycolicibacterium canariasense TaxID=228230 RepID=A0A100WHG2_MYCCR|nr:carboxylate-amine ligase [Mycolicibacterium canariasense]